MEENNVVTTTTETTEETVVQTEPVKTEPVKDEKPVNAEVEKLKKEHPMECDAIVAEVLTWAADLISEYDEGYMPYTRMVAEKALKKVATDYPGLLHRDALCETIDDFLYQHEEDDCLYIDGDTTYIKKER